MTYQIVSTEGDVRQPVAGRLTLEQHRRMLTLARTASAVVQGGRYMRWLIAMDLMREYYREQYATAARRGG